ncbi:HAMP domain-containing protein [Micromonospora sp. NPDC093277]|uniref:HAMP domain-containing sensor histidine kinase n=1 Tax=Micromonospora sp. NPDC093277 TaxID=3364291 RepID=UPI0037FE87DA
MFSRFGLRFRMAASYVAVSAAAVLIVEGILLAIAVPQIESARHSAQTAEQQAKRAETSQAQAKARVAAIGIASTVGSSASFLATGQPELSDGRLLAKAAKKLDTSLIGSPNTTDGGEASTGPNPDTTEATMAVATVGGDIVLAMGISTPTIPAEALSGGARIGLKTVDGRTRAWAVQPIAITNASDEPGARTIGLAYEELPSPPADTATTPISNSQRPMTESVTGLITAGALILVLLVPVGALFGLFSTGRLIQRIRRLALGTEAMADGDLRSRIPISGGDEVGQLEHAFNTMAERLEQAITAERDAAGSAARRAERTRIARELHDSISQDLFSASLVAGGLRKALPSETLLWRQAGSMEVTLERTRREMRAMLMELRPVALEDAGLAAALEEMCRAYEARLGIPITARIELTDVIPAVEHAVLRVVQEALGNAVRHGNPTTIEVEVTGAGEKVTLTIRDDGTGFDLERVAERRGMGLDLIRERVEELGGTVHVVTAPQQGTTVRVML